jgi:hypothetical protein
VAITPHNRKAGDTTLIEPDLRHIFRSLSGESIFLMVAGGEPTSKLRDLSILVASLPSARGMMDRTTSMLPSAVSYHPRAMTLESVAILDTPARNDGPGILSCVQPTGRHHCHGIHGPSSEG